MSAPGRPRTQPSRRTRSPASSPVRCPWCGAPTPSDYVHGHAQCVHCKHNLEPCCEGEQAQDAAQDPT